MSDVINAALLTPLYQWLLVDQCGDDPALQFGLFTNDYTVTCTDILTDYTECSAPGYAPVDLVGGDWTEYVSECVLTAAYPTFNISFSGPGDPAQTIYGYYLIAGELGVLYSSNNLSSPYSLPAGDSVIAVSLSWVLGQCGVASPASVRGLVSSRAVLAPGVPRPPAPRRRRRRADSGGGAEQRPQ